MKLVRASQNKFIALDDAENRAGSGIIRRRMLERVFPESPVQYEVEVKTTPEARDLLYAAATTRARLLVSEEPKPCRAIVIVPKGREDELRLVENLGFKPKPGIIRMRRRIDNGEIYSELPGGLTEVKDYLADKGEFMKCLTRFNECFGTSYDAAWLKELRARRDFIRIMAVSSRGIGGEALLWSAKGTGYVEVIQTARAWRRKGVATALLEAARRCFDEMGLKYMEILAWADAPGCLKMCRRAGFDKVEITEYHAIME